MLTRLVLNASEYSAEGGFPLLMPRWGYVASASVLFLIGFLGFFLNLFVIILMCKDRQLWTPLNIILLNLVCSDFSVSVLGNPFTLTSAIYKRWVFGRTMCVLYGFFMALLGITSITTLTVLSFERYMMVSRPFSRRRLTSKGAVICVGLIWLYSLTLTTPPLFGWGNYVNEAADISCSVNWEEQTFNTLTYILFLFSMAQVVPVAVISFSYINIIRTMRRNNFRMGRVTRAEARVTLMVFIMILAFMIAWTPYSILALIEQFAPHDMVSPGLGVIPALVAKSSICYNPLIYVGMNTQFRASVKSLLGLRNEEDTSYQEQGIDNTVVSRSRGVSQGNDVNIDLQQYASSENDAGKVRKQKKRESGKMSLKNYRIKSKNFSQNEAFAESDYDSKGQQGKNKIYDYLKYNDERDSTSEYIFPEHAGFKDDQSTLKIKNEKNTSKETSSYMTDENNLNVTDFKYGRRSRSSYENYSSSDLRDHAGAGSENTSNAALEKQPTNVAYKPHTTSCGRFQKGNAQTSPYICIKHSASMEIRRTRSALNRRKLSATGIVVHQEDQTKMASVFENGNVLTKLVLISKQEITDFDSLDTKTILLNTTSVHSEELV